MAKSNGWITLHRRLLNNPICEKPNYLAIWVFLLLSANHEDKHIIWNNRKTLIKRGSFIGSISKISKKFGLSTGTVSMILDYFISESMIEKSSNYKFTLFTILKYNQYQRGVESPSESKLKASRKQAETNNNDNNDNNIPKGMGQARSYGNSDINKFIRGVNKYLEVKLPDDGKARQVAKNALELFTKKNSKGIIKQGREFLKEDKWENVKDFLVYYLEEKVDKGYSAQSWFRLYDNIRLWIANEGKIPSK